MLRLFLEYDKEMVPALDTWYKSYLKEYQSRVSLKDTSDLNGHGDQLWPYQQAGVRFILHTKRVLVADEPGTGKTIQAIYTVKESGLCSHVLVVCPKSLTGWWDSQIRVWHPGAQAQVISSKERGKLPGAYRAGGYVILNWEILRLVEGLDDYAWDWFIGDEATKIKNPQTQVFAATTQINAGGMMLMTGTPVANHPGELWALLNLLYPQTYTSYYRFYEMFVDYSVNYYTGFKEVIGVRNKEILTQELAPITLLRTKAEVLPWLPEKTYKELPVEMTDAQARMYREMAKLAKVALEKGDILKAPNVIAKLTRLRQIASTTATLDDSDESGKLDAIEELLENELANESVLVFTQFRETVLALYNRLTKRGVTCVTLMGGFKRKSVDEIVGAVQSGEARVLIATVDTGGVGLTLTRACKLIFVEKDYNPSVNTQAEDRCIAEGQLVRVLKRGLVPIETILAGDNVLTHMGRWRPVVNAHKRQCRGILTSIETHRTVKPLVCTHDHQILVYTKDAESLVWKPAWSIIPGDMLVLPEIAVLAHESIAVPSVIHRPRTFMNNGIEQVNSRLVTLPDSIMLTNDALYSIGYYLANGWLGDHFVGLCCSHENLDCLTPFTAWCASLGITTQLYEKANANAVEMYAYSIELRDLMMHLCGKGAEHKRLSPELLQLAPEQSTHLLQGYISGDGHIKGTNCEWSSVSATLAYDMCLLAAQCGYTPGYREVDDNSNHIYIGGFNTSANKTDTKQRLDGYALYTVTATSSKLDKYTNVYDLEIAEDHSFVVGLATVHNCHRIGQDRTCQIITLRHPKSIDDFVERILSRKIAMSNDILRGEALRNINNYLEGNNVHT